MGEDLISWQIEKSPYEGSEIKKEDAVRIYKTKKSEMPGKGFIMAGNIGDLCATRHLENSW